MSSVAVVGAGAWGTALAIHLARAGRRVTLWARNPAWEVSRENPRLPGLPVPDAVTLGDPPPDVDAVLLATPVQHLRAALGRTLPDVPLVLCMKGLELGTGLLPLEILAAVRPAAASAVLTGPNFAHELARGLPAAGVLACSDPARRRSLQALLGSREFRLYGSADPVGAQVGGAVKNVVAIAAGIAMGAGLGENARAALVTRGVAELARLTTHFGGRAATASGLSGVGDLVLTCCGPASRNYRLGHAIGQGVAPQDARARIGAAVEGMDAASALLARSMGVSRPIIEAVAAVLAERMTVAAAMGGLLDRPGADE